MDQEIPDYDMDSEDEQWLNKQAKKMEVTPLKFENMMDRLEKGSGQTVSGWLIPFMYDHIVCEVLLFENVRSSCHGRGRGGVNCDRSSKFLGSFSCWKCLWEQFDIPYLI